MGATTVAHLADQRVARWAAEERARTEGGHEPHGSSVRPCRTIITISRQFGAEGHTLAHLIAEQLGRGWEVWDKEIVDEVASRAKVRTAMVEALDEHSLTREEQILRYITNYWGISPENYHRHLIQVLLALSQQGRKIIIGRGAALVLREALNVRLYASQEYRVKGIMAAEHIDAQPAKRKMAEIDTERARFVRTHFNQDIESPLHYSMMLQVDRLGRDVAATTVVSAMRAICGQQVGVGK